MKTDTFYSKLTSNKLKENIEKQFNAVVSLENYSREQLEDLRNKLRTKVFQHEGSAKFNDLLTSETYQKDKAMLELLNTRIKEMLGEDIKKLKAKLEKLQENKKGVKAVKHPKGSKGSDGNLANNYPPFDKVTRGDVVAGALGKDQKGSKTKESAVDENRVVKGRAYGGAAQKDTDHDHAETPSKGSSEKSAADRARDRAADKAQDRAGKDWEARGYKRTVVKGKAQSGSPKDDDDLDESKDTCNHTPKGKKCPVHGLKECGTMKEAKGAKEPFAVGMAAAKKQAGIKKTPAKDLPKAVVKKGHEIGKSIKKSQKDESTSIYRRHVKIVNESLQYLLSEDEEEKAQAITAAGDMANDFTSWMQRVGQYQTKVMIELSDEIRHNFGAQQAEAFKQAVAPALAATLETLTQQREAISNAIAVLAGGEMPPPAPMGAEPGAELGPEMGPAEPDQMNEPPGDEFGASDAAAGSGTTGREMRESKFVAKLKESHSIISKLAK